MSLYIRSDIRNSYVSIAMLSIGLSHGEIINSQLMNKIVKLLLFFLQPFVDLFSFSFHVEGFQLTKGSREVLTENMKRFTIL